MLELEDVSLRIDADGEERRLLDGISARFPPGSFVAVIGPSGCGKTTLLKLVAGVAPGREDGSVRWRGRDLSDEDFHASEISYVPQFGIAHEELTAAECVEFSIALRDSAGRRARRAAALALLDEVGLGGAPAGQLVRTLSGGQRRRLALAMELASRPHILLCDEVTSGLDPQSEEEIVELLHGLSRSQGRLVLSVTHSLAHLHLYDAVLVLAEGATAFFGPADRLLAHFSIDRPEQLYARLREHPASEWAASWRQGAAADGGAGVSEAAAAASDGVGEVGEAPRARLPGALSQFGTLLSRRCLILARSRSQMLLQLVLMAGFPLLVAIFAWGGLPEVPNLAMGLNEDLSQSFDERRQFLEHASEVGSAVSGIVMFQVVLLCLMGANNSGREIAVERSIFEKERLAGLAPAAYVASKAAFLAALVAVQSFWMGSFVHYVCDVPGSFAAQLGFLLLVNAAVTSVCLGISSLMATAEQASLASIYLVGFQLPLSGAVLALPEAIGPLVRPFVSAYWSWSGYLQTMQGDRHYDFVQSVAQSPVAPATVAALVLALHVAAGLTAAWIGCERHRPL